MSVKNWKYKNQTLLHQTLSESTYRWLRNMATNKGLIWRQEHTIHNGMRPDAVGFCSLQIRFQKELIGIKHNGIKNIVELMFVFETKVSYSDYKNTFNGSGQWKEKTYANLHYLVVPKGFSKTYDLSNLPDYWGILEPDPRSLKIKRQAKYCKIEEIFFYRAAYTLLFKKEKAIHEMDNL